MSETKRLVWDLPLRAFHWLFAVSILASWLTAQLGFSWMKWHMRLGYWTLGLLIFRFVWGLVGPRHARFTSFLKSPADVLRYARNMKNTIADPVVGHNPMGALMVIGMLALVSVQATTGLFATDDIAWQGPYYPSVSTATAQLLSTVHRWNIDLIWLAIATHIAAILYYAFVKKDNLVPAMLTGLKSAERVPADQAISDSQVWKAVLIGLVSAGIVCWILSSAPPPTDALL
jgi:cytochrome b